MSDTTKLLEDAILSLMAAKKEIQDREAYESPEPIKVLYSGEFLELDHGDCIDCNWPMSLVETVRGLALTRDDAIRWGKPDIKIMVAKRRGHVYVGACPRESEKRFVEVWVVQ